MFFYNKKNTNQCEYKIFFFREYEYKRYNLQLHDCTYNLITRIQFERATYFCLQNPPLNKIQYWWFLKSNQVTQLFGFLPFKNFPLWS